MTRATFTKSFCLLDSKVKAKSQIHGMISGSHPRLYQHSERNQNRVKGHVLQFKVVGLFLLLETELKNAHCLSL